MANPNRDLVNELANRSELADGGRELERLAESLCEFADNANGTDLYLFVTAVQKVFKPA